MSSSSVQNGGAKPYILFTCFPGDGHLNPMLSIADHLQNKCGYETGILTIEPLKPKIEAIGAEWLELQSPFTEAIMSKVGATMQMPPGAFRHAKQFQAMFLNTLSQRTEDFEKALQSVAEKHPGRKIIVMDDIASLTVAPYYYGRPWPAAIKTTPKSIGVGIFPLLVESQDTTPWLSGIPSEQSEGAHERNRKLHEESKTGSMKVYYEDWEETFKGIGASVTSPPDMYFQRYYKIHDAVLQLCSPSLEYHRSDLPSNIEFAGVLPPRAASENFEYPTWWSNVTGAKAAGKRVVLVSQGSLQINNADMILPAMKGFADVPDLLVIATLGAKGAQLPKEVEETVPANVRVLDYLPYEVILPYTDVFLSNGGYGGYTQAVTHAVPMICAGETEDKPEVAMRVEAVSLGVNLKTMRPSPEQVREAVTKVLGEPRYAARALELKKENDSLDVLTAFQKKVAELSA